MNQKKITDKLIKFRDDRSWGKFHTAKNLAIENQIEAGELAKLFSWGKNPPENRVAEEIADNAIYLLYLCEKYGFNLEDIILQKIAKNELKYATDIDHADKNCWQV